MSHVELSQEDYKTLQDAYVERDRLREALERIREHAIERDRYIPMTGTIRACDEALNLSRPEGDAE